MQVVRQGSRERCAHLVRVQCAGTKQVPLSRHDSALKVLFYEMLHDLGLIDELPPWYSPVKPKPVYESDDVQAYWDVPMFAEHQEMRSNRVDAHIINHKSKQVTTLEMNCPWVNNREEKSEEKTHKYGPPALGIETAVPRLRGATAQHHQGIDKSRELCHLM